LERPEEELEVAVRLFLETVASIGANATREKGAGFLWGGDVHSVVLKYVQVKGTWVSAVDIIVDSTDPNPHRCEGAIVAQRPRRTLIFANALIVDTCEGV